MKNLLDYNIILWDFDGVILNSMPVRSKGFEEVLSEFPAEQVQELLTYHHINGGLSRYVKFRYFFEKIRNEKVDDEKIYSLANQFSSIMLRILIDEGLLIKDSINFIRKTSDKLPMHIVSGSDEKELKIICQGLNIANHFISINGSPTAKNDLVSNLLSEFNYNCEEVILIGDSINDYEASVKNNIAFAGYNNSDLRNLSKIYIDRFADLT